MVVGIGLLSAVYPAGECLFTERPPQPDGFNGNQPDDEKGCGPAERQREEAEPVPYPCPRHRFAPLRKRQKGHSRRLWTVPHRGQGSFLKFPASGAVLQEPLIWAKFFSLVCCFISAPYLSSSVP